MPGHESPEPVRLAFPGNANEHQPDTLEAYLRDRCDRDGVALRSIAVGLKAPPLPAEFTTEPQVSWQKLVGKLEDRYGYVPVYQRGEIAIPEVPPRITQIGRYLYFGQDAGELAALRTLVDGSLDERSSALDIFGDDTGHAVSLFMSLLKRDLEPQIRIEAAHKLQSFPTEKVISGLVQALGDRDDAVQSAARAALIWVGNEQALNALRVAARSQNSRIAEMAAAILEENLELH